MKQSSIRPDDLVKENQRLYAEDLDLLMEGSRYFVEVRCPACGYGRSEWTFTKGGLDHVKCDACDTLYINPRPPLDMLIDYYETAKSIKHWNAVIFPATEEIRRREIFNPRADRTLALCSRFNSPREKLVDVGAGYGTFCMEMVRNGHFAKVVAVEPSPDLAATCRERGLKVLEAAIENVGLKDASVITAFEMIEHLFSPTDFLKVCHEGLAEGGLLIMTTPNIKGFDLMTLGAESENIGGPNHLQYFHPTSMVILLKRRGFQVLALTTPGKLDAEIVRNAALNSKLHLEPFLQEVLLTRWAELGDAFQKFLQEGNLSSNMMVVARKA